MRSELQRRSSRGSLVRMRGACAPLAAFGLALVVATPALASGSWDWATGPSIYDGEGKREWSVEVIPYLFIANLTGELQVGPAGTIPVVATFPTLASNLDSGFAGVLDVRFRRWHLISDNSWVSLKASPAPAPPVASAAVGLALAFGTVAVAYELPLDAAYALDVYLGARWWHVNTDLDVVLAGPAGPFSGSRTVSWADAVVGARVRYRITDSWRVAANADVGGGQAKLDWSVFANVGYDWNEHFGVTAGYRIVGVDFSQAPFGLDVKQSGLLLGANIRY